MKNLHVKRDDMVVVISGEDRGKIGKVLATYPAKHRVLVEGINIIKKALRKSQDNPKGGISARKDPSRFPRS
jgi:large subunit ribosomal protein L24